MADTTDAPDGVPTHRPQSPTVKGQTPKSVLKTPIHRQVRKAIKTRGAFPDEQAATKLMYLAILRAQDKWRRVQNWTPALAALKIHFEDRLPD